MQSTGQSENNNPSQQDTGAANDPQQEETRNDLPDTLAFQRKNTFIKLPDWESVSLFKGKLLTYEDCNAYNDGLLLQKNVSYPKEFFDSHSLILVELSTIYALKNSGIMWEVTDVSYENGVLRCAVTQYHDTSPAAYINEERYVPAFWACFIEIDTVLPEGSQIALDFTDAFLDWEEYSAKYPEFKEKVIQ